MSAFSSLQDQQQYQLSQAGTPKLNQDGTRSELNAQLPAERYTDKSAPLFGASGNVTTYSQEQKQPRWDDPYLQPL